ncbi:insulin-like peptide INSL5 [Pelobates fuscus]|uniref:insulin-like peptide INSL5 n=1 Tax=Pelobates fuscus TaxID=191477 RepID=UPI002FE48DCB
MRAVPVGCVLLLLLVAVTEVKGDGQFVKLCGREFIRAVIYTCGGSRWRRLLLAEPEDVPDRGQIFDLHNGNIDVSDPSEYQLQKLKSHTEEVQHSESMEDFWDSEKYSFQERRDLNELLTTACCKTGCKKKDLSSLC